MTQEEDNFAPSWHIRTGFQTWNQSTPNPPGVESTECLCKRRLAKPGKPGVPSDRRSPLWPKRLLVAGVFPCALCSTGGLRRIQKNLKSKAHPSSYYRRFHLATSMRAVPSSWSLGVRAHNLYVFRSSLLKVSKVTSNLVK